MIPPAAMFDLLPNDAARFALAAVGIIVGTAAIVWALGMQRRALERQRDGLARADESVAIARRMLEIGERSVAQQDEIIRLLRMIAERNA